MTYIILKDSDFGFAVKATIDLPRFAADLAKELGGVVQPTGEYPAEHQAVNIGETRLWMRADNHKRMVNIGVECIGMGYGSWNTHDKAQQTKSMYVNPDGRKIAAIAKDVRKRAIEGNSAALKARRDYMAAQIKAADSLASVMQELKKGSPSLDLRFKPGDTSGTVYASQPYVSARVYANGTIGIDRLASVPVAKFLAILKLLES